MSTELGNKLIITIFGKSHGEAVGVVMSGLPVGEKIDMERLLAFMARRQGGKNGTSTARTEKDVPVFLSGLENSVTDGSALCAVIKNEDARSGDYSPIATTPRPGHADYTAYIKYGGKADMSGGGQFSGRLTAPLCVAGGIAKQLLEKRGIFVGAHLLMVASVSDRPFPLYPTAELFNEISAKSWPVLDDDAGIKMRAAIIQAADKGDSVGGIIQCAAIGLPAGLGGPMFDGVESRLSAAIFGIPAVKGVEFGSGFNGADLKGSQNNDPFVLNPDEKVVTTTNNCGGILGGITNGMPVVFNAAIKPTPSIAVCQDTVDLASMKPATISVKGRHDPCIAGRAVPVVEAVTALVVLDMLLEGNL